MKHFKMHTLSCLLATVLITVLLTTEVAATAPLKRGVWSIVPSPNVVGVPEDVLEGVAAVSAKDVWAVGFICSTFGCFQMHRQTLIEHWNGKTWSIVPSPNVGSNLNSLAAVAVVSHTSHVWAVGAYKPNNNSASTLTEFFSERRPWVQLD